MLELDGNEGITSMALVRFEGTALPDNSLLLAVGTAEQMTYFPTSCTAGYIRLYRWGGQLLWHAVGGGCYGYLCID